MQTKDKSKTKNLKALVLFSGGQDSTTCLFWAKQNFTAVQAIAFNYGQRHKLELTQAASIAALAKVELFIFDMPQLGFITSNALTNSDIEVESGENRTSSSAPPNTLVEGRNMLFLTYAAIFAKAHGIDNLVTGVSQADFSGYPDCREVFIKSIEKTLRLSNEYQYKIHTPLMHLNKKEVWQLAHNLGVVDIVANNTLTCYNGIVGSGCTKCPACMLRQNGYNEYIKELH